MGITTILLKYKLYSLGIILGIIAVLILSVLSGIRSNSIGTDTNTYNVFFNVAVRSANFSRLHFSFQYIDRLEIGFTVLNYVISRFTTNYHIFQFVCGLIINTNIFIGLFIVRDKVNLCLGWLTYCFLFFGNTINILRQALALSFVFLGFCLVYVGKSKLSIPFVIIACSFHTSAIISIFILLIGYLLNMSSKKYQIMIIIGISLLLILLMPLIVSYLSNFGLLGSKYENYLSQHDQISLFSTVLVRLPMFILIFYSLFINRNISLMTIWMYLLVVQEFLLFPLQMINPVVGRLMLYFGISKVIAYPLIIRNCYRGKISRYVFTIGYLMLCVLIFYYQVVINNNGQIYPFVISSNII